MPASGNGCSRDGLSSAVGLDPPSLRPASALQHSLIGAYLTLVIVELTVPVKPVLHRKSAES